MNKSQLISTITSLTTAQAQLRYDHVFAYIQVNKQYPRLRYVSDKASWAKSIDSDFGATVATMITLWYRKLADYRMVARALTQYHTLVTPRLVRMPKDIVADKIMDNSSVVSHNISTGIDVTQWDSRYSRNLDSDLQKLLN
jgi:hypothetical protein